MTTTQGTPHLWKDAAKAHFHRWADHYDRDVINILLFEPSYRRVLAQLRHWGRRGLYASRLLDVGCGTGSLAILCRRYAPATGRIIGLDMSEAMLDVARKKAARLNGNHQISFTQGDAEHLPFADASFDVVTCCNSFHHYPHQDQALREMRRVLAPGGHVILIDGCRDNPFGYFIFDIAVARVENHVHHCSAGLLRQLMAQAGFKNIEQSVFGVCPPALMNIGTAP